FLGQWKRGGPGGAAVWRRRGAPDGERPEHSEAGVAGIERGQHGRTTAEAAVRRGGLLPADGRDIFDRRKGDGERPDRPSGPACRPGSGRDPGGRPSPGAPGGGRVHPAEQAAGLCLHPLGRAGAADSGGAGGGLREPGLSRGTAGPGFRGPAAADQRRCLGPAPAASKA
ncbi:translation initiation factor IF-3, partial [Dysosmobacter welbionis]